MYLLWTCMFNISGEDFDQRIMEYFSKLIIKKHGKYISKDDRAMGKLRRESERALSNQHQVRVEIESLFDVIRCYSFGCGSTYPRYWNCWWSDVQIDSKKHSSQPRDLRFSPPTKTNRPPSPFRYAIRFLDSWKSIYLEKRSDSYSTWPCITITFSLLCDIHIGLWGWKKYD